MFRRSTYLSSCVIQTERWLCMNIWYSNYSSQLDKRSQCHTSTHKPPAEKKSRGGGSRANGGGGARTRWFGTRRTERDQEANPHGAWWFSPGAVSGRIAEKCDGQPLQSTRPSSYPYFAILKDRLYRVTQDAQTKQDTTQLLVPKSHREMLF